MRSVVLLSGGIDSAVCLTLQRKSHTYAVGIDYGQPHAIELRYAKQIAAQENVPFEILQMPTCKKSDDVVFNGRNFAMIGLAVAYAAGAGATKIVVGSNFTDFARFPDCRPEFFKCVNQALDAAKYGIWVSAPLLHKTKKQVMQMAKNLKVGATWSCYSPIESEPCGECLACQVRNA